MLSYQHPPELPFPIVLPIRHCPIYCFSSRVLDPLVLFLVTVACLAAPSWAFADDGIVVCVAYCVDYWALVYSQRHDTSRMMNNRGAVVVYCVTGLSRGWCLLQNSAQTRAVCIRRGVVDSVVASSLVLSSLVVYR